MSRRPSDTQKEKAVSEFLDKYFYVKPSIEQFSRKFDTKSQYEGIDVTFRINHQNLSTDVIIVDEKSAAHYVNKQIPTFAFELQFQNSLNIKSKGWLFDEEKDTTHYLLSWIKTSRGDSSFSFGDITELEVMIISREAVQDILKKLEFKLEKLEDYISKMLEGNKDLEEKQSMSFGKFKIHYSGDLSEKSINVTINKKYLKEKCMGHFKVTPTSVERVEDKLRRFP